MKFILKGNAENNLLFIDGKKVRIKPSLKVHYFYPFFVWGHNAPETSKKQMALAIMLHVTKSYEGFHKLYYEIIKHIPEGDFEMSISLEWKEKQISIKNEAIVNAHAYNKHLTIAYLKSKPIEELVCFVHPLDRDYYINELGL